MPLNSAASGLELDLPHAEAEGRLAHDDGQHDHDDRQEHDGDRDPVELAAAEDLEEGVGQRQARDLRAAGERQGQAAQHPAHRQRADERGDADDLAGEGVGGSYGGGHHQRDGDREPGVEARAHEHRHHDAREDEVAAHGEVDLVLRDEEHDAGRDDGGIDGALDDVDELARCQEVGMRDADDDEDHDAGPGRRSTSRPWPRAGWTSRWPGDARGSVAVTTGALWLKTSCSSIRLDRIEAPYGGDSGRVNGTGHSVDDGASAGHQQLAQPSRSQRSRAASWRLMPRATALMGGARRATSAREASTMSEMAPRTLSSASRMGTPTEAELRPISMRVTE